MTSVPIQADKETLLVYLSKERATYVRIEAARMGEGAGNRKGALTRLFEQMIDYWRAGHPEQGS